MTALASRIATAFNDAFAITPNDTVAAPFTALYIGGAGDVTLISRNTGASVVFKAVPVGTTLYVAGSQVMATGTTATNIVGLG